MADWDMVKAESPTLRKASTTERTVGSVIAVVSGLGDVKPGWDIARYRHSRKPRRTLDSCQNGGEKDRVCGVVK